LAVDSDPGRVTATQEEMRKAGMQEARKKKVAAGVPSRLLLSGHSRSDRRSNADRDFLVHYLLVNSSAGPIGG
jgi:hypothetical protein